MEEAGESVQTQRRQCLYFSGKRNHKLSSRTALKKAAVSCEMEKQEVGRNTQG